MEFEIVEPVHTVCRAARLTSENLEDVAKSVNGVVEDGVLKFTISNHTLYGLPGDWVILFGTDIHIFSDKYYRRNYKPEAKKLAVDEE